MLRSGLSSIANAVPLTCPFHLNAVYVLTPFHLFFYVWQKRNHQKEIAPITLTLRRNDQRAALNKRKQGKNTLIIALHC
ncbi:hypothetical protein NS381_20795 [Pantoea stewartii]|nr:hypothetical protein NS381_20795 [Pantoea stewartii]